MSEENVQVVRRIVEAHQRGDFATVFAAYDPAIEWRTGDSDQARRRTAWTGTPELLIIDAGRPAIGWISCGDPDGKVIRVQFFANRDDALDAAGRSE